MITLNLTLNQSTAFTDNVTACNSFTWIDGKTYTENNNSAIHIIQNLLGCDSIITLDLEIITIDTSITISGNTLTANSTSASYQWLDCNSNNSPIPGATNQSFTPLESGNYAVELTVESCVEVSNCYSVTTSSTSLFYQKKTEIYPNPTQDKFFISIPAELLGSQFKLINSVGKVLENGTLDQTISELSLHNYAAGVYFIEIDTKQGIVSKKIVRGH